MLITLGVLAACAATQEQAELFFEETFDEIDAALWETQGEVRLSGDGSLLTESVPDGEHQGLKGLREHAMPALDEDAYVRVEWTLTPMKLGGWGSDLRINGVNSGNPFVVEFTGTRPTLNAGIGSKTAVTEGQPTTMTIDFTRSAVLRWTIDGEEQLAGMAPAWQGVCGDAFTIGLNDFTDTKSATRWDSIRLYKVTPEDPTLLRVTQHDARVANEVQEGLPYILGVATAMDKVFRQAADFGGRFSREVEISAAGRERESFQVVLIPLAEALTNATVTASDLVAETGGAKLTAERVAINVVDYIQTQQSNSAIRRAGWWWPDVLNLPRPVSVEPAQVQPIWVTVDVPAGTPAGNYRGILQIEAENVPSSSFLIKLRVRDYDLPVRGQLKTAFCICAGMWEIWYKPDEVKERLGLGDNPSHGFGYSALGTEDVLGHEKWLEMYDFLLAHRISPNVLYAPLKDGKVRTVPSMEDLEYCVERGQNAICLMNVDAWMSGRQDEIAAYLDTWKEYIETHDVDDVLFYVHGFDESEMRANHEETVDPQIRELYGFIGENYPMIKRETANPVMDKHAGFFDIWTPLTQQYRGELAEERRAEDEEVWVYVCCGPGKPYANYFIDFPGVDPRVLGWQMFQTGTTGLLYYLMNHYQPQTNWNQNGLKWPEVPWNPISFNTNSDGILFYPGPDATPLASTRLANIRDGIEDYEALAILRERVEAARANGDNAEVIAKAEQVLAVDPEVSESWTSYTKDPERIIEARGDVDDLIEALSR